MSNEKFCLRWNDFENNISNAFKELRDDKNFFDVTLACDDEQIQAHKVILAACSPFFCHVLRHNKIWEKFPNRRKFPISIWKSKKPRGGGLNFSKMSEFQLFDSVVCNITFIRNVWNSKSSEFDLRGGGRKFSKSSEIQKVLNYPRADMQKVGNLGT